MKSVKDWDAILAEMSDGGDSDAGDDLNIMSVQRNAHRVAELVHNFVPGLDASQRGGTPMGMNRPDPLRDDLVASSKAASRRSSETNSSSGGAARSRPADSAGAAGGAAGGKGAKPGTAGRKKHVAEALLEEGTLV